MRSLLLAALLAAPLPSQVVIVDVNNGPGTNFTQISAAVAAVSEGAVLIVRAGTYTAVNLPDKSLTILGEPGVIVDDFVSPLSIAALSATKAITVRQVSWRAFIGPARFTCSNCAGRVLIDDCTADFSVAPTGGRIVVTACDRLIVRDSRLQMSAIYEPCIVAHQSNVLVDGCTIRANRTGIEHFGGNVHVTGSTIIANGSSFFGSICIWMHGGDLRVNGDTTFMGAATMQTPAIGGQGSATIDPSTVLQSIAPMPFTSGIIVTNQDIPTLLATTQALGGTATAILNVPVGSLGVIAASIAVAPLPTPFLGGLLWIEPVPPRTAGIGPMLSSTYSVPNSSQVLGIQVAWQGAVLTGGSIALSNASCYAHF